MAIYNIEVSNNFSTRVSADTHILKPRSKLERQLTIC